MPRNKQRRKIEEPPRFSGYAPYGVKHTHRPPVELYFEEYEAIKLTDYNGMTHQEACRYMGISRATFARIYEHARRKIAHALVEAREIKTVMGNAILDEEWYLCTECYARFRVRDIERQENCPTCRSGDFRPIA